MTNINLNIAKELNGSNPYMAVVFLDSYGDALLKELTLDDIAGDNKLLLDNYFCPCGICGLPVVDSSIVPDTQGVCDHCYKKGPDELIQPNVVGECGYCKQGISEGVFYAKIEGVLYHEQCNTARKSAMLDMALTQTLPEDIMLSKEGFKSVEERIGSAVYMASAKFWAVVADLFPECKTGDLEPLYVFKMEETMKETVTHWVENNKPKPRAQFLSCKGLHFQNFWYLIQSDIDCDVAVSTNMEALDRSFYIAVDKKSVTFHEDDFKTKLLFNEQAEWFFGDNPTVLMNYLDTFTSGFDTCKLFDDIMTIGKSDKL